MSYCNFKTSMDISIPYQLYQAQKGNYFVGQTPILSGSTEHALALLQNPCNSNKTLYVNSISITNISDYNLSAEFYLKSQVCNTLTSDLVSCTNTGIDPEPTNKGKIKYVTAPTEPPNDGVSIFSRIASPNSTLVVDGNQIILAPDQSLTIYIGGFSPVAFDSVRFSFEWWEEIIHSCINYCS